MIILDLDMPIMNGFEACERIRKAAHPVDLQALFQIDSKTKKEANNLDENCTLVEEEHLREDRSYGNGSSFIVALSGLINKEILERGKECGFDEMSKLPLN